MKKKGSVLFLLNIPAPYRVDFLNELNKNENIITFFEKATVLDRNEKWYENDKIRFRYIIINKNLRKLLKYLKELICSEIIVIGGYSTPLTIISILTLNMLNKKFVLAVDGGFIKRDKKLLYNFKKYLISSASYWLSTGNKTDEYLIYYGAKKERIYFYPFSSIRENEISDISNIEKDSIKQELNFKSQVNVLYVGRFIESKNVELLLQAAVQIKNVDFHIIGGVPTHKYLEIASGNNNIYFYNHMKKEEVSMYYKACDLFVFPTKEDVWGLVINESMAHGLPIITTNKCIAGLEMIDDTSMGYIFDVDIDLDEFVEVLQQSIVNINSFSKENLYNKASNFTIEKMANAHIEIFNQIRKIQK